MNHRTASYEDTHACPSRARGPATLERCAPSSKTAVLLRRAQAGQDSAWNRLVEHHRAELLRFIERRMGAELRRECDPADVFNEAWLRCFRRFQTFEQHRPGGFRRYLHTAALRVIQDRGPRGGEAAARQAWRERCSIEDVGERLAAPEASASSQVRRRDDARLLIDGIESLPSIYREVLTLSFIEGLDTEEISNCLDRKADTVRKQIRRGLERLRDKLDLAPSSSTADA